MAFPSFYPKLDGKERYVKRKNIFYPIISIGYVKFKFKLGGIYGLKGVTMAIVFRTIQTTQEAS
jgi:hypothetical protein